MRKLWLCIFIIYAINAEAQMSSSPISTASMSAPVPFSDPYDLSGKRIPSSDYLDIQGSPMLNKEWGSGWVVLKNGQQFSGVPLQFSIAGNELYFKKDTNVYVFAAGVSAFKMRYDDNGASKEVLFKNGYPDNHQKSSDLFYQVLADGPNVEFLKLLKTDVHEEYVYNQPPEKRYVVFEDLYFFDIKNNKLIKFSNNKKSITDALPQYNAQILAFISANNSKLRSNKDIIALTDELNKAAIN